MVGGTDSFSFTGTPSGDIAVNNETITVTVSPGQYTSVEASAFGWELTGIVCDDGDSTGDLATRTATFKATAGEIITAFTNQRRGRRSTQVQPLPLASRRHIDPAQRNVRPGH
jgi:hypothetical protein